MLGLPKKLKIHFVGIGGIGMSGIADVLLSMGYLVSGSDINPSATTDELKSKGAEIYIGHNETNIQDVNLLVYSSAIDFNNPEIKKAKSDRIPFVRRAEMLAELMRLKYGIAIAGSHGKTTTTSMVATIFHDAGKDPTHIIGGIVNNLGSHAKMGASEYLIAEADESDGSFLHLNPIMAVVTNVDNDHLDFHKTEENIKQAFIDFVNKIPFYGKVAINAHDKGTNEILSRIKRPYVLFGIARNLEEKVSLDYVAWNVQYAIGETSFELWHQGSSKGKIKLSVSGEHNVLNALAAISISHETGLTFVSISQGISKFKGVGRRLESLYKSKDFEIIDDYGHHPTEIKATLKTLKEIYKKKICVVFEPHRYSRTKQLWNDFINSFEHADEVFVGPIYAASEAAIPGISSDSLVSAMVERHGEKFKAVSLDSMNTIIEDLKNKNVIFLTLGAGSISKKIKLLVSKL